MREWDEAMVSLFRPDLRGGARVAALRVLGVSGAGDVRAAEAWMWNEVERRRQVIRAKWNARARNRLNGDEWPSAAMTIFCWISAPLWCVGVIHASIFVWMWSMRLKRLARRSKVPQVDVARQVLCVEMCRET